MSNPSNQSKSLNLNSVRNQKSARRSLELSDYIVVEKPKQNKKNKKGRRSDPVLQSVSREESCPVVAEKLTIAVLPFYITHNEVGILSGEEIDFLFFWFNIC